MKRDLDLIRKILLKIEDYSGQLPIFPEYFSDLCDDQNVIDLHLNLLADSDFIEYYDSTTIGHCYKQYHIIRMTSAGYDYLDSIRDDTIWKTTKEKLAKVGGSATLDIVKDLATAAIMKMIIP